jgi:aminocarboxymuconate-semialdehyde decarboxylase
MTSISGETSGFIDVHAHFADPDAVNEMHALAPDDAPSAEYNDPENRWEVTPAGRTSSIPIETGIFDLPSRLHDMDDMGIQYHALAAWTSLYFDQVDGALAAELLAIHNDSTVKTVRAHPDRFVAMGGLPMQDPVRAVEEVIRLGALPEVVGVQLPTNVAGHNLDDPMFEPIWEALADHGLPVLLHPYGPGNAKMARLGKYHLSNTIGNPLESAIALGSMVFGGVLQRHPGLRVGLVHGGGHVPFQLGRWDHGWRVRSEAQEIIAKPPSEFVEQCYFEQLTHDPRAVTFLAARFGWDHVLIGTDYPWDMSTTTPLQELIAAGLPENELDRVGTTNAKRFLRWPRERQHQ